MQKQSFHWLLAYRHYVIDILLFIAIIAVQPTLKRFLTAEIIDSGKDMQHYSPAIGWLYICTSLSQGIGALLVRKQIAVRLQSSDRPSYRLIPLLALMIMHFIIYGVLFWLDGIKYITQGSVPFWAYLISLFPTVAVTLVIIPDHKPVKFTQADGFISFGGTVLLAFSALVSINVFWQLFVEDLGKEFFNVFADSSQSAIKVIASKLAITLLFAFLFLLFYAPPRLVFLATDWHRRITWLNMLIVFCPFITGLWLGED